MCRRKQVHGWMLLAFGLGLLAGMLIDSHFWCCCFGTFSLIAGFLTLKRN